MDKQEKVVKKIKSVGNTGSGINLGTKKNDECYTDMKDIIAELSYWANLKKFKGKNIICPCDWDITDDENIIGITITYKENNVETNVYKAVKSIVIKKVKKFPDCPIINDIEEIKEEIETQQIEEYNLEEKEIEEFLRDKLTCNFVRTLTQNARRWGIKSITASGYNPAINRGIKFQDVDYSKYDICITNPPFSLYGEFMNTIVDTIDFIVLAPFMNRATPNIGLNLMLRKAYLGHSGDSNAGYLALNFLNPTKDNRYNTKKVACDWITSFSDAQDERNKHKLNTGIKYDLYKDDYIEMPNMTMKDGTHPIKVACDAVPDDFTGWMFSSPNILTKISHIEYEWYGTNFKGYLNKYPNYNPLAHNATNTMVVTNGKGFHGVLFRKKQGS